MASRDKQTDSSRTGGAPPSRTVPAPLPPSKGGERTERQGGGTVPFKNPNK